MHRVFSFRNVIRLSFVDPLSFVNRPPLSTSHRRTSFVGLEPAGMSSRRRLKYSFCKGVVVRTSPSKKGRLSFLVRVNVPLDKVHLNHYTVSDL